MRFRKESSDAGIETIEALCRRGGIKLTGQRREIIRVVSTLSGHPTTQDIHKRVRKTIPTIALDTVYRTITTLEQAGIIKRVNQLDDKVRYDSNPMQHHHLVCTRCRGITDFYWNALDKTSLPRQTKKWGTVSSMQVELRGICAGCRSKQQS